jgi:hypothetical protein
MPMMKMGKARWRLAIEAPSVRGFGEPGVSKLSPEHQENRPESTSSRIDRPHGPERSGRSPAPASDSRALGSELASTQSVAAQSVGCAGNVSGTLGVASDQLEQHAAELADRLRQRQHDLRRHEQAFHAQIAQWEDEQRSTRLYLREQLAELEQRRDDLDQQERRLDDWSSELQAAQQTAAAQQQRARDLDQQQEQLEQARSDLDRQRQAIQEQRVRLEQKRCEWRRTSNVEVAKLRRQQAAFEAGQRAARELSQRLRQQLENYEQDLVTFRQQESIQRDKGQRLKSLEMMLRRRSSELDQERISLARERNALYQRTKSQRRSLAEHWRNRRVRWESEMAQLADKRRALRQQEARLEAENLRAQRLHRESVEARLVAEHIRRTVEGQAAPNDWQSAAESLHAWVDAQLKRSAEQTANQEAGLKELARKLAEQQQKLERRREELTAAIADQQQQNEIRAQQLDQREYELDARSRQLDEARRTWNAFWRDQQSQQSWI